MKKLRFKFQDTLVYAPFFPVSLLLYSSAIAMFLTLAILCACAMFPLIQGPHWSCSFHFVPIQINNGAYEKQQQQRQMKKK